MLHLKEIVQLPIICIGLKERMYKTCLSCLKINPGLVIITPKIICSDSYFYWVQFKIIVEFILIVIYTCLGQRGCAVWFGFSKGNCWFCDCWSRVVMCALEKCHRADDKLYHREVKVLPAKNFQWVEKRLKLVILS